MSMSLVYLVIIGFLLILLGLFAFVGLQYLTRGTPISRIRLLDEDHEAPPVSDPQFRRMLQMHVNTSLEPGNRLEILSNGDEVFPPLWEALSKAEYLITWHVYWFRPGELADKVKEVLAERARAGVKVLFLIDAFGSWGDDDEYFKDLREAGVEIGAFRPLRWNTLYKFQQRSHIRAVVIDGKVGFTGGFAINDLWKGDGRHPGQWRDTSVRMEGPAVLQLQSAFAADWAEATGQLLIGEDIFPRDEDEHPDGMSAGLVYDSPSIGSTNAERFFALSFEGARESLYLTSAYFVPDDDQRRFLAHAVKRGVDVRVLTPGANTDKESTWYAARAHYEEILASGVRIYEYDPTMVHAKTMVADGVWGAMGTNNLDNRSMALNDEVILMVHDRVFGERSREIFLSDLEYATELKLEAFRRRGAWERVKERYWLMFSRIL